MLRNYIKICSQNIFKSALAKQNNVFNRKLFATTQIITENPLLANSPSVHCYNVQSLRQKSKSSKKTQESESDSDSYTKEEFIDGIHDKNTKVLDISVTSLRVDAILKSALGVARNKIETLFYESKIRVNGEMIAKKSASVQIGDEIDLLKGPDLRNPNFMNVARVEILSVKPNEDSISVKIRRCKSLTVDSY